MTVQSGKRALIAATDGQRGAGSHGLDFYNSDRSLKALLGRYLAADELRILSRTWLRGSSAADDATG